MNKNKLYIGIVCLFALLFCAFAAIPHFNYVSAEGNDLQVSYPQSARYENQTLNLAVDYQSYGEGFEIIKHMTVATDSDFENILRQNSVSVENGLYQYCYDAPTEISQVYISPPVIYTPVEIDEVSFALETQTSQLAKQDPWFTIENVALNGVSYEGTLPTQFSISDDNDHSEVVVTVSGNGSDSIPRLPKLTINGNEYGGVSAVQFDENMNFDKAVFTFFLPAELNNLSAQQLSSAQISVSQAMTKVTAVPQDLIQTPNILVSVINE